MFVCLGNICRSPMAEAVFSHRITEDGIHDKFHVESSGTAGYHIGERPDHRSVATCEKHGVPVSHRAQKASKAHFNEFDFLLCMDLSNLENLRQLQAKAGGPDKTRAKVFLLGQFHPKALHNAPKGETFAPVDKAIIVEDPYYGEMEDYEVNFKQCTAAVGGFLTHLRAEGLIE